MPKTLYQSWNPGASALEIIDQAEEICADYAAQGYDLTLRQLYYQFVSRALIPNTMQSYKRLGDIVDKARLAGLLDWDSIVDRTRNLRSNSHWRTPAGDHPLGGAVVRRDPGIARQPCVIRHNQ